MGIKSISLAATALVLSTSANAALIERLGGLAYYDTDADLTWLADANMAGGMKWSAAMDWAANLDVDGVTGWRLPDTVDSDGFPTTGVDFGYNITDHSEMSNLFYNVLGNTARYDIDGVPTSCYPNSCLVNTGPFSNMQSNGYWSATKVLYQPGNAFYFMMNSGEQGRGSATGTGLSPALNLFAMAVQSGDVSAVPVPAAVWLFGSGLIGLIGLARRKKT